MSVVYMHIATDSGIVFYIGIGSAESRAYSFACRNRFWHFMTQKHGCTVDILYDNISLDEAKKIEKELIKRHGRRDIKTGTLVNMTIGGDGVVGYKATEILIKKLSSRMMGNKYAAGSVRTDKEKEYLRLLMIGNKRTLGWKPTAIQKSNHARAHFKPIIQLSKDGLFIKEWESIKKAGESLGIRRNGISTCLKGIYSHSGGFKWEYA